MKILVVGAGYVGLPAALAFAEKGHRVTAYDTDTRKVKNLQNGRAHLNEPELEMLLLKQLKNQALKFVDEIEPSDVFLIAVPTPIKKDFSPDLEYVETALRSILTVAEKDNLIIIESTCPIGTTDYLITIAKELRPDLCHIGLDGDKKILLDFAYCPERVMPGRLLQELRTLDRLVGGTNEKSSLRASNLYREITEGTIHITTAKVAEMTKLSENAFRDINIAFANELETVASHHGIDVSEVINLGNVHPRVNILHPGPGVGGHCIAIDPYFLLKGVPQDLSLIKMARQVNTSRPFMMIEKVRKKLEECQTEKPLIVFLGLSYKSNSPDIRESPAIPIIEHFLKDNTLQVLCFDPLVERYESNLVPYLSPISKLSEHLQRADMVVQLTDHDEFQQYIRENCESIKFMNLRW